MPLVFYLINFFIITSKHILLVNLKPLYLNEDIVCTVIVDLLRHNNIIKSSSGNTALLKI